MLISMYFWTKTKKKKKKIKVQIRFYLPCFSLRFRTRRKNTVALKYKVHVALVAFFFFDEYACPSSVTKWTPYFSNSFVAKECSSLVLLRIIKLQYEVHQISISSFR